MPKFYEIVVIATLVSFIGAMTFENIKERYLRLSLAWRVGIVIIIIILSYAAIYFGENLPTFKGVSFTVPVPIPVIETTTVTIKRPLLPSILFGAILSAYSALGYIDNDLSLDKNNNRKLSYFTSSPLMIYPIIAFSYKFFFEPDPSKIYSLILSLVLFINLLFASIISYKFPSNEIIRVILTIILFVFMSLASSTMVFI